MTGEELVAKLQSLTSEQRKLPVLHQADDVGRWRETLCLSSIDVKLANVDNDGHDQREGEPNSICIF